jgi:DNA-binding transcriptional ArsR family regulator/cell division protein FtsB
MSKNDEDPYSTIFASLKHPIRRRILRMLSKQSMSFTEMVEVLGVSSSFLTYHLDNLEELIVKMEDGKYKLSSFGEAAISTMEKVEDIPKTTPIQSPQAKPKKVSRSVAVALGLICIVLISLVTFFTVTGISAQDSYNNLQNQNKQLQKWLEGNETLLNQTEASNTSLQSQINYLNSKITGLQNQLNNLTQTLSTAHGVYDGLELTMTLNKINYSLREPVNVTLTLTNISNQTIEIGLGDGKINAYGFDFKVYNGTNNTIYSSSWPPLSMRSNQTYLRVTLPFEWTVTIDSGQSESWTFAWQQDSWSAYVLSGQYNIIGQFAGLINNVNTTIETVPIQIAIS